MPALTIDSERPREDDLNIGFPNFVGLMAFTLANARSPPHNLRLFLMISSTALSLSVRFRGWGFIMSHASSMMDPV
jgi:hypothetical protein